MSTRQSKSTHGKVIYIYRESDKTHISKAIIQFLSTGSILLLTISLIVELYRSYQTSITSYHPTPYAVITNLEREKEKTPVNSPEYISISRMIGRVKRKASGKIARPENPGAFIEAMAEVKTSWDGKTYPPNYKTEALKKASSQMQKPRIPLPWKERGPGNVSGRARAVVIDPDDVTGDTWFVASVGGGIWKTTNAGGSWTDKTPMLTTLSTTCLAMAPSNHDVLYAGTGMGYGRIVDLSGSGVWKSTDRGETWFQLESTSQGQLLQAINRIVVDPRDENTVLLCSNDGFSYLATKGGTRRSGIFRTTDGGSTWTQVFDPDAVLGTATDNRVQQIISNPQNFNTLYATVNEVGVIKSTDAGQSWFLSAGDFALTRDIGSGDGTYRGISVRTEMAIAPTDTARLYAAVERPYSTADLFMSTDAGVTWRIVYDTGEDPNWFNSWGRSGSDGSYTSGWFNNTIVVHPFDEDIVYVGGVNLYRIDVNPTSASRTTTPISWWTQHQAYPYAHADHHFLTTCILDGALNRFRIVDANDGGVAVSDNGGANWNQITGMGTTQFYGVDKKPGENVYIGGMQDNGTYHSGPDADANSPWIADLGGDGFEVAWNVQDPDLVLGCSQYGNLRRSIDGGLSWQAIPQAKAGDSAPFITKIASSKIDPDLIFTVGSDGVKRSDDFGASWTLTWIQGNWLGWRAFDNVEISMADPQIVWISSRLKPDTYYGVPGGIHVSSNGGISFSEVSNNFPDNVTESSGIGSHPLDPNTAYFLFSAPDNPKILKTTDLGATWNDISGFGRDREESDRGFPDVAVFSLIVMPHENNTIWAGTEIGLVVSEDGGETWSLDNSGLPRVGIFDMKIVDDQVVLATQGRGVWSVSIPKLLTTPPRDITLSPRLNPLFMSPTGSAPIPIDLRSPYDSTYVYIDGTFYTRLDGNDSPTDTTLYYPVTETKIIEVVVDAFKNGTRYLSPKRAVGVYPVEIKEMYSTSLNVPWDVEDFYGTGWIWTSDQAFTSPAFHTAHPYANGSDLYLQLKAPIKVNGEDAILQYRDVAIVEVGDPGSQFGDAGMYDYVIVEGSNDGVNWRPLIPGYDSRFNREWLTAYENFWSGHRSMFVQHRINLLDTFEPGEIIFIRFRLFADSGTNAWGWVIDDIQIQSPATRIPVPESFQITQNYPNPFNSTTTIRYDLPESSDVVLRIFNTRGQEVVTLVDGDVVEGSHFVEWDGRDQQGLSVASGVYFYRIETNFNVRTRKMTLLR